MSFRGVLQYSGTDLRWVIVLVPFDPTETWPVRIGLHVKGTVNGFPFRTSLFGLGDGRHVLLVNKKIQKGAHAQPGSAAEIVLEPDMEERSADPPPELAKLLKQDRAVKKWYQQLNLSMRRYMADAVSKPKSPDARRNQAERWMELMMLVMEGEQELPPVLKRAFRGNPQAHAGWQAMTAIQRRNNLLAIFHCQGPEARAKRAEKAAAEALRIASRHA